MSSYKKIKKAVISKNQYIILQTCGAYITIKS